MNQDTSGTRIALIVPGGIGTGRGNVGVPVLEQLVKLISRDFEVTVFSLFKVNEDYSPDGFEIVSITAANPIVRFLKALYVISRRHRKNKFQIIHGFWAMPSGFLAVCLGKFFGIKSVVSLLGGDAIALPEIRYGQLQRPLPRRLIRWTLFHAWRVISLTQYLVNNLKKEGLLHRDIRVIPWGIDTSTFTFNEKPFSVPIQFLHVANLHPVKDQETLLRAFDIISRNVPSHLTIIGEGESSHQVKTLAASLGLLERITFQAPVPYASLPSFYHRADILLHTSLSEGQSEVVTEAMSCGVIVCGTNVGLIHDLPGCSVGVPVRAFEKLGGDVLKLLQSPASINTLRANAHQWTTVHSIYWTAEMLRSLYREPQRQKE